MALRHNITNDPWALAFGRQQIRRLREQLLDDEPNEDDHMISRVYRVGGRTIHVRLMGENEFIYLDKKAKPAQPAQPTYHILTWNFEKQRYEPFDEEWGRFDGKTLPFVTSPRYIYSWLPDSGDPNALEPFVIYRRHSNQWNIDFNGSDALRLHPNWNNALTNANGQQSSAFFFDEDAADILKIIWDDGTQMSPHPEVNMVHWGIAWEPVFNRPIEPGFFVCGLRNQHSEFYTLNIYGTGYDFMPGVNNAHIVPGEGFRHTQGFKIYFNDKYIEPFLG